MADEIKFWDELSEDEQNKTNQTAFVIENLTRAILKLKESVLAHTLLSK